MNKIIVAIACVFFIFGVLTALGLQQATRRIGNVAAIKTVGVNVYEDASLTKPLTSIDWGTLEPGENKNVTAYIVNTSNVPVVLSLTTGNWNPTNTSIYVSLTWNYSGAPIPVGSYTPVVFTLHISPVTTGITNFSFDITIVGAG